jgi:cell fate regulator YaaT (PSP1 superfamily)
MSDLIEVVFKGNRKEFFRWEDVVPPPAPRTHVVVEGDRGEDLGQVHAHGEHAEKRFAGVLHGAAAGEVHRRVIRVANREEVKRAQALIEENETTRRAAMAQVRELGLQMKLTDAEWQWDRRKLTFFFTAEKRVDFRTLVRDLAATFKARIELKQIGVRDEAKRLDGIGRCGRQYCSASWLPDLRPVNLGVAKDQKLSLNPTQISGACGRLMCCLRYEHDFYVQSRKRFPKEGKIITTLKGEEKIMFNDIFHDRVTLRAPDGESRILTLVELRQETATWTLGTTTEEYPVPDSRELAEEGVVAFDDAPPRIERTRVPASDRTLPVFPVPLAPAPKPVVAPGTIASAEAPKDAGASTARSSGAPASPSVSAPRIADAPAPPRERAEIAPPKADLAPPKSPVAPRVDASVSDDGVTGDHDDEDGDDGEDDTSAMSADAATGDGVDGDAPRRRRRRGRRGGRRGRGSRPPSGDDPPPNS